MEAGFLGAIFATHPPRPWPRRLCWHLEPRFGGASFLSLSRPLHHQRRPAKTTHRAIWDHRHHTNLVRIASLLRADMIFGNDRPFREGLIRAEFHASGQRAAFTPKSRS